MTLHEDRLERHGWGGERMTLGWSVVNASCMNNVGHVMRMGNKVVLGKSEWNRKAGKTAKHGDLGLPMHVRECCLWAEHANPTCVDIRLNVHNQASLQRVIRLANERLAKSGPRATRISVFIDSVIIINAGRLRSVYTAPVPTSRGRLWAQFPRDYPTFIKFRAVKPQTRETRLEWPLYERWIMKLSGAGSRQF